MDRKTVLKEGYAKLSHLLSLKNGLLFAAGGVFVCGSLPGGGFPFGTSLVCAVSGKVSCAAVTAGAIAGSVISGNVLRGLAAGAVFLLRILLGLLLFDKGDEKKAGLSERLKQMALNESVYARMMLAAAVTLIFGGVALADGSYTVGLLASSAASGALCPVLVFLYETLLSQNEASPLLYKCGECAVAVSAVLGSTQLLPFADLQIPSAFAIAMLVTLQRGALEGVMYGVILSLVTNSAAVPLFAVCALCAAPFGRIAPAAAIASGCFGGASWALYSEGLSAMGNIVPKLIVTSAILAPVCVSGILPKREGDKKSVAVRSHENMALVVRDSEMRRRMNSLSEGLRGLSEVLYRMSDTITTPDTEELCELCEASFDEYCSKCGMKSACFGRELKSTTNLQSKMVLSMKREGRVSAALVPKELASRCFNMGQIIDSMNAGCARMIAEAKLYDRTAVVAADYEVTSKLLAEASEFGADGVKCDGALSEKLRASLERISFKADRVGVFGGRMLRVVARGVDMQNTAAGGDDIVRCASAVCKAPMSQPEFSVDGSCVTMSLTSLPSLAVRCGRASVALSSLADAAKQDKTANGKASNAEDEPTRIFSRDKRGLGKTSSEDCGDVINAFLTDEGRFFMLISDGMGSGREAAMTSGICAVFIEKLLRAGASMDTALKMLNSMMRARNGECSATVDLMELDLMNGSVRFVKSGAAPSFVIRDGRLFRLQSKTVPIGIMRALDAEMIRFEASAGDVIVMLSDGVAKSFEDCPWLYDLLGGDKLCREDPELMARTIVKYAVDNGAEDDITAGVVVIDDATSKR